MYLKISAAGPEADQIGHLLGRFPEKLFITEPPNARLRLILESASPGNISFTMLAYPEPATGWESSPAELQIVLCAPDSRVQPRARGFGEHTSINLDAIDCKIGL